MYCCGKNVTRAAEQLGITQPALSNGLRRLRDLFHDPLLVRTSAGMTPTERAAELQPMVRQILSAIEQTVMPTSEFEPEKSQRDGQRMGWVDEALAELGLQRHIRVFTRHYQVAAHWAAQPDLVATLPSQMAWSPLLQHDGGHAWMRRRIIELARDVVGRH
jgi:DNA-binding transcriptional LysR family regulator